MRRRKRTKHRSRPAWAGAARGWVATIAQYRPDDRTVTKVVAAVTSEPGRPTEDLRRWVGTDITASENFRRELLGFLRSHAVRRIVLTTGVIGCIHEEGEDYPTGQECPYCPFWQGRDRWAKAKPILLSLNDLGEAASWPDEPAARVASTETANEHADELRPTEPFDRDTEMKKLPIDIGEIATLAESAEHEDERCLDVHTGEVVIIPSDLLDIDLDDDNEIADLPDWEKELIPAAREMTAGSDRYVPLPEISSDEAYEHMAEFTRTVQDPQLRRRLTDALNGKRPFRRFKDVLLRYPEEEKRWFRAKDEALEEYVREWLSGIGIEPIDG